MGRHDRARLTPPEIIRLPDGREIPLITLINRVTNRLSYNLRARLEYGYKTRRRMLESTPGKYTKRTE